MDDEPIQPFDAELQLDVKDDLDPFELVVQPFSHTSPPAEEKPVVVAVIGRSLVTRLKHLVAFVTQDAHPSVVLDVNIGGFLELGKLSGKLKAPIKYRGTLCDPLDTLLDIVPDTLRSVDWAVPLLFRRGRRSCAACGRRSCAACGRNSGLTRHTRALLRLDVADPGIADNAVFYSATTLEEVALNVRTLRLSSSFKDRKVIPTNVTLLALVLDQRRGSAAWDKKALWCTLKNLDALRIPTVAVLHPVAGLLAAVLAEQFPSIAHVLMLQDQLCLRSVGANTRGYRWLFTGVAIRAVEELVASTVWESLGHLTIHNRQIDSNIKRLFAVSPKALRTLTVIVTSTASEPPSARGRRRRR